jgi:glycosyltransferase involved in cell wall biosynthesis
MNFTPPRSRSRILHVFPTFEIGGAQKRFAQIAKASLDRFHHDVLALDGRYGALRFFDGDRKIALCKEVSAEGPLLTRLARYRNALNTVRPDLLVTYNWGAVEWAFANLSVGLPHVQIEDGFGPEEADHQIVRRIWLRRLALARSKAVVVPSLTLKALADRRWRLWCRVRLIPNGIDLPEKPVDADARAALRRNLGLGSTGPVICWIGSLRKEKNVIRLLRAFARLSPGAALVLLGDGEERPAIESEVRALGLTGNVHLIGMLSNVEDILPAFDILAMSSDTEQMPIAILEAMAAGLPVAAVDVGDIAAMVSPENGPFIVERSEKALAGALSTLVDDAALRVRIGEANRAHASSYFSGKRMTAAYIELFESAVGRCAETFR